MRQVARAALLEETSTVGSVESYVMQILVQLDLDGCILVRFKAHTCSLSWTSIADTNAVVCSKLTVAMTS